MKIKLWLNIATFVAVGLIVWLGWHDIVAAFETMMTLNLWILSLMIPMQFFVFFALAKMFHHFFSAVGTPLSAKTIFPAVIELNFVNHVFPSGGVSGFSYLTLRLKREGISTAKSTLAQLMRFILGFAAFVVLIMLGLLLLVLEDRASRLIIFMATSLTSTILFSALTLAYVIGSKTRIDIFTNSLTRFLNRIIHFVRRNHPETIRLHKVRQTFLELHEDYMVLKSDLGKMKRVVLWAFISHVAEVALIYIAFVAHDAWINPGALVIAYAVATVLSLLAILPGGVGVFEPLMAAILLSAGVPKDIALSATLVSRVVMLTLALGSGYILYHKAIKHYGTNNLKR